MIVYSLPLTLRVRAPCSPVFNMRIHIHIRMTIDTRTSKSKCFVCMCVCVCCELDLGRMRCRFVNSLFCTFVHSHAPACADFEGNKTEQSGTNIFSAKFITKLYCANKQILSTQSFIFCLHLSFISCERCRKTFIPSMCDVCVCVRVQRMRADTKQYST